jgi:hypothetical protein
MPITYKDKILTENKLMTCVALCGAGLLLSTPVVAFVGAIWIVFHFLHKLW